jgi:hypothetical protein
MDSDSALAAIGIGVLIAVAMFVLALLFTVIGAFVGWVVGLTPLGGWVISGFSYFGVHVESLTNLGAMLGFIAGIFADTKINSKKN